MSDPSSTARKLRGHDSTGHGRMCKYERTLGSRGLADGQVKRLCLHNF